MRSFCLVLATAGLFCAAPASADPLPYTTDFSDVGLGTGTIVYSNPGSTPMTVTGGGGTLEISKPVTATGETGTWYAVIDYLATGNFRQEVTVDFSNVLNTGTGQLGFNGGISVNFGPNELNSSQVSMMIDQFGAPASGYGYIANGVTSGGWMTGFAHPDAVTFRLDRVGNTVSHYVRDGNSPFVLLDSVTNPDFAAPARFFLNLSAYLPTTAGGSVRFSDFKVLDPSAVPEPSIWFSLIGGFAIAGGALRRSRRRGRKAGSEDGQEALC